MHIYTDFPPCFLCSIVGRRADKDEKNNHQLYSGRRTLPFLIILVC